jgi:hypothetical protein
LAFSPNGDLLWKLINPHYEGFIVGNNGTIMMYFTDRNVTGYGPNGTVLWTKTFENWFDTPVVWNGTIYGLNNEVGISGLRATICAFSWNSSLLWRYPGTLENTSNAANYNVNNLLVDNNGII